MTVWFFSHPTSHGPSQILPRIPAKLTQAVPPGCSPLSEEHEKTVVISLQAGRTRGCRGSEHLRFPWSCPRWSTAATFTIVTGARQGAEVTVTESQPRLSWAQTLPIRGCGRAAHTTGSMVSVAQSTDPLDCQRAPHKWALGLLAEGLEGTLPR